jgi:hypothetical protein
MGEATRKGFVAGNPRRFGNGDSEKTAAVRGFGRAPATQPPVAAVTTPATTVKLTRKGE